MSQQIELNIGKDLQFIRVNGTLVGGSIGLVLYLLSQIPSLLTLANFKEKDSMTMSIRIFPCARRQKSCTRSPLTFSSNGPQKTPWRYTRMHCAVVLAQRIRYRSGTGYRMVAALLAALD